MHLFTPIVKSQQNRIELVTRPTVLTLGLSDDGVDDLSAELSGLPDADPSMPLMTPLVPVPGVDSVVVAGCSAGVAILVLLLSSGAGCCGWLPCCISFNRLARSSSSAFNRSAFRLCRMGGLEENFWYRSCKIIAHALKAYLRHF